MLLISLITALHVFVALFMILVVLLQGGNSGGIGATLGGGNSSGVFGATGANSMLTKLTYIAAFIFMVTSLSLSMMKSKAGTTGLYDRIKQEATQQQQSDAIPDNVLDNVGKLDGTLPEQNAVEAGENKVDASSKEVDTKKENKKEDKVNKKDKSKDVSSDKNKEPAKQ